VTSEYDTTASVPAGSAIVTAHVPGPATAATYRPVVPVAVRRAPSQRTEMLSAGVPDQAAVADTTPPEVRSAKVAATSSGYSRLPGQDCETTLATAGARGGDPCPRAPAGTGLVVVVRAGSGTVEVVEVVEVVEATVVGGGAAVAAGARATAGGAVDGAAARGVAVVVVVPIGALGPTRGALADPLGLGRRASVPPRTTRAGPSGVARRVAAASRTARAWRGADERLASGCGGRIIGEVVRTTIAATTRPSVSHEAYSRRCPPGSGARGRTRARAGCGRARAPAVTGTPLAQRGASDS